MLNAIWFIVDLLHAISCERNTSQNREALLALRSIVRYDCLFFTFFTLTTVSILRRDFSLAVYFTENCPRYRALRKCSKLIKGKFIIPKHLWSTCNYFLFVSPTVIVKRLFTRKTFWFQEQTNIKSSLLFYIYLFILLHTVFSLFTILNNALCRDFWTLSPGIP